VIGDTVPLLHLGTKWRQSASRFCLFTFLKRTPLPPVGPTADVGAVTHRRAPGIEPRSVGLAAASAAHYTDSVGQDRGKLQLTHVVMMCCTTYRYPSLTHKRQTEDKAGGGGGGAP
jgi:hypothetical protein